MKNVELEGKETLQYLALGQSGGKCAVLEAAPILPKKGPCGRGRFPPFYECT